MDRSTHSRMSTPKIGLVMTTALASVALSGCTMSSAPAGETSFAKAQVALEKGQVDKAISHAEAAVLAEPRNPGFRAMLGAAYLEAGRFDSAATSFEDALALGSDDPRTVLSYSLAKTALGDSAAARAKLNEWQGSINPADYGLAIALAGDADRGVQVLTDTLRDGQNTAKVRQNLAYTYALAGNWRAARVMASEDVPEDYQVRVASLLNVTPVSDGGQPQYLALSNFPSQQMMVAEAEAQAATEVAVAAPQVDIVPNTAAVIAIGPEGVQSAEPKPVKVAAAPAPKPKAKRSTAMKFVSNEVIQKVPAGSRSAAAPVAAPAAAPTAAPATASAAKPAPTRVAAVSSQRRMAVATGADATHLVQLGSFNSRQVAEAKWNELQRKFPSLEGRDAVITEAKVNGQTFFRVAAAGFGASSARSMCSTVKSQGTGCFAYAASSPPAGAVDREVRVAARTR